MKNLQIERSVREVVVLAVSLSIILGFGFVAIAQTANTPSQNAAEDNAETPATDATPTPEKTNEEQAAEVFNQVKNKLNQKSESLSSVINNISLIESNLAEASESIRTLEEQVQLIDDSLRAADDRIKRYQSEINLLTVRINLKTNEIEEKEAELAKQKELIKELTRFLYVQNINIGNFDSSFSQTMKLLFSGDDADEQLTDLYYLELIEQTSRDTFLKIKSLKDDLENKREELLSAKNDKVTLQTELVKDRNILEIQKQAKIDLLEATKGKEDIYRSLLEQAKGDQAQVRREIAELGSVYDELAAKLDPTGSGAGGKLGSGLADSKLTWPLEPSRGVSAFFRDPSYKAALGVNHNAVDIRAVMQTPVVAAADGVVYKVKGGEGLDYHYVIIAHRDGILTLYGHLYDIFVNEGDIVRKGSPIGLSGGLPGSRGAGYLTTGPHLHFEVFADGKNVDPLFYLDLSGIDQKYLPEQYLILRK